MHETGMIAFSAQKDCLCMFGDKATTNELEIKQQFSKMPRFKLMSSDYCKYLVDSEISE